MTLHAPLGLLRSPPGAPYSPTERVARLLRLERRDTISLVIYAVCIGLMSLIVPIATQTLVNTLAFTALAQPIVVLSVLVLLGFGIANTLRAAQTILVERVQERLFAQTALDSTARLLRATDDVMAGERPAPLVYRFLEIVTIQKAVATLALEGLSVLLQSGVGLLLLCFYHPALLVFALLCMILMALVVVVLGRQGPATAVKESKAKFLVADVLERVAIARVEGVHPNKEDTVNEVDAAVMQYLHKRRIHFRVVFNQTIASYCVQVLGTVGLLALGGSLVLNAQITLGQLMASELVVASVLEGFSKFGKHLETYYDLTASVDKLGEVLDLESEA